MVKTKVILTVALVVLVLILLSLYGKGFNLGVSEGFDPSAPPVGTFTLYYANWCPHCKTVKPDFADFGKNGYITVNGKNVKVAMVEESEKDKMAGKEIKGFPSFMFESVAGETVEYNGPRTRDGWMDFLRQNCGS